jgi:hypothetical protein
MCDQERNSMLPTMSAGKNLYFFYFFNFSCLALVKKRYFTYALVLVLVVPSADGG